MKEQKEVYQSALTDLYLVGMITLSPSSSLSSYSSSPASPPSSSRRQLTEKGEYFVQRVFGNSGEDTYSQLMAQRVRLSDIVIPEDDLLSELADLVYQLTPEPQREAMKRASYEIMRKEGNPLYAALTAAIKVYNSEQQQAGQQLPVTTPPSVQEWA